MVDRYTSGTVNRMSQEAPVPILEYESDRYVMGGAANVAHNIVALKASVDVVGVIGEDEEAAIFLKLLRTEGISPRGVLRDATRPTTMKHRFLFGRSQLLRVDRESQKAISLALEKRLFSEVAKRIEKASVVILSDYGKGVFGGGLAEKIIALAKKKKKMVVADIKPQYFVAFKGVDLITPNKKEAEAITGETHVSRMGQKLVEAGDTNVLVTQGGEGMTLFLKDGAVEYIPAHRVEVFDVSGAGDTVTAVASLALSRGFSFSASARLANYAGSVVVGKIGTAPVTEKELQAGLNSLHVS